MPPYPVPPTWTTEACLTICRLHDRRSILANRCVAYCAGEKTLELQVRILNSCAMHSLVVHCGGSSHVWWLASSFGATCTSSHFNIESSYSSLHFQNSPDFVFGILGLGRAMLGYVQVYVATELSLVDPHYGTGNLPFASYGVSLFSYCSLLVLYLPGYVLSRRRRRRPTQFWHKNFSPPTRSHSLAPLLRSIWSNSLGPWSSEKYRWGWRGALTVTFTM